MTEFTIQLVGDRGVLLVEGRVSPLFGELVGCKIERIMPLDFTRPDPPPSHISALPKPVVEVTLRLPLGGNDRLTLVRDTSIETLNGPTESEIRSSGPGAVALLDRWLAQHEDEPGGALIAKARELLTGNADWRRQP
jgi:hypothetical protein